MILKKMDRKKRMPYIITKLVGDRACKLLLPVKTQIHPVFHVSLLEPFRISKLAERRLVTPDLREDEIEGKEE